MDVIEGLVRRRTACEQEIREQRKKIEKYEDAYESLRNFRSSVNTSRRDFESINRTKLSRASDLSSMVQTCRTAERYLAGSQRTLDGIGGKVVGAAFIGLDVMIGVKLGEYRIKIQNCETRIASLRRTLSSIESMINTVQQAETEVEQ